MAASTSREPHRTDPPYKSKGKGKGKEKLAPTSQQLNAACNSSRDNEESDPDWEWYSLTEPSASKFSPIFSRDGSFFFALAGSTVKIHSVATGRTIATLSAPRSSRNEAYSDFLTTVVLNPHNAFQLITGSLDGRLVVWDFLDAVVLQTIDIAQPIHHICCHEKWKDTVFVAASPKSQLKFRSMADAAAVLRVSLKPADNSTQPEILSIGKTRFPTSLALSSCGAWLVATAGHKVYVASTSSLTSGFTKYISPERLTCLSFHPYEQYFATGDDKGNIRLWYCLNDNLPLNIRGVEKKTQTVAFHWHAHAVSSIAFTANGAYLLSGGEESVLVIWQLHTGKKEFVPRVGAPINTISVYNTGTEGEEYLLGLVDATYLVISSGSLKISKSYGSIKLEPEVQYASPLEKKSMPLAMHSLSSTLILPSSHPSSLQIFSPSSSRLVSELEVSPSNRVSRRDNKPLVHSRVEEAIISPSGDWLATIDARNAVDGFQGDIYLKLWSWDSQGSHWSLNTRIDKPHGFKKVTSLAFSPASGRLSTRLVTTGQDKAVKIWGVRVVKKQARVIEESWVTRSVFEFRSEVPRSATWSRDGSLLLVAFDLYVALYDPTTNVLRQTLTSPGVREAKAAHSVGKSGRFVVVAGDHNMTLWDLISSSVLWTHDTHLRIDKVVPHTDSDHFTVFQDTSIRDSRSTRVSIFGIRSPTPSSTHSTPLSLRHILPYPSPRKSSSGNFVAITDDWRVVVLGKGAKQMKGGGSFATDMAPSPIPARHTLFQDIFGKTAFTKQAAVGLRRLHNSKVTNSKATKDVFDTPTYLAPPLEHLFDSLMDEFLKNRQDPISVAPTLEDEDMSHVDETSTAVPLHNIRSCHVFSQEETDVFVQIFRDRDHYIGSQTAEGGLTTGVKGQSASTPRRLEGKKASSKKHVSKPHRPVDGPENDTTKPSLPLPKKNGRKRKQSLG